MTFQGEKKETVLHLLLYVFLFVVVITVTVITNMTQYLL